jgi:hypothetical protein
MKKLLIGLMALGSMSAFASTSGDCKTYIEYSGRSSLARSEYADLDRWHINKLVRELKIRKYQEVASPNEADCKITFSTILDHNTNLNIVTIMLVNPDGEQQSFEARKKAGFQLSRSEKMEKELVKALPAFNN